MLADIKSILIRDLLKLANEIESYKNDDTLWLVENGISNSAGNLCLHLLGNLNHYIGAVLGNTNYARQREKEFSEKGIPKNLLLIQIKELILTIEQTIDRLHNKDLEYIYPVKIFESEHNTGFILVHLCTHLTYHLGQINYHRRLLDQ